MDTTIEEKRKILHQIIDSMIVNDIGCKIALCSICDNIMLFDDGDMGSGHCEDCQNAICGACGGLHMVKEEEDIEEEEVEDDQGEIITITRIHLGTARFLCGDCICSSI